MARGARHTGRLDHVPAGRRAVAEADARLRDAEGHGLERLVGALYEERGRLALDAFRLTQRVQGYWDKGATEIDLVALNEQDHVLRLGTCKRNADRAASDLTSFEAHVQRFLDAFPHLRSWRIEKAAITTRHTPQTRLAVESRGYIAQDLVDLTEGM
jgi:hypothetical protein